MRVRAVRMNGPGTVQRVTPDLSPETHQISLAESRRVLGIDLSQTEAVDLLKQIRHDAEPDGPDGIQVTVPAYRRHHA